MPYASRIISTERTLGQPQQLFVGWYVLGVICFLFMIDACQRPFQPLDPDPRLAADFCSPKHTFQTWVARSLVGDRQALAECYWSGLGEQELSAYLAVNLQPESRKLLHQATWQGAQAVSLVEVNFAFLTVNGNLVRGVMVRTGAGWKLQSW